MSICFGLDGADREVVVGTEIGIDTEATVEKEDVVETEAGIGAEREAAIEVGSEIKSGIETEKVETHIKKNHRHQKEMVMKSSFSVNKICPWRRLLFCKN